MTIKEFVARYVPSPGIGALAEVDLEKMLQASTDVRTPEVIALRGALRNMADAYVRKVKSGLSEDDITKEPWRCAEYIEAERLCKVPLKLHFTREWLREQIKSEGNDPDLPCEAGPDIARPAAAGDTSP